MTPINDVKLLCSSWTSAGDASPLYASPTSPIDLFDRVEQVGRAGFKGIGLLDADLRAARDRYGKDVMRDLRVAASDAGLEAIELEYLTGWYSHDAEIRKASVQKKAELLEWAAEVGALQIKVGTSIAAPDSGPPNLDEIAEAFGRLCEEAAAAGTRIAMELHPWADTSTPAAGLTVAEAAPHGSGGLLIDAWQAYRGGWDLSDFAGESGARVIAVELADANQEPQGTLIQDSINGRRLCGEGDSDVPAFIGAMRRAGFDGYWGLEILSEEHRSKPVDVALRDAFKTTMRQFDGAQA